MGNEGLASGEDSTNAAALTYLPKVSLARLEVMGAGEERLNGVYTACFLTKDRIEFEKVGDEACQVFWCHYHNEWRMLIGDYKMGNTLYRHPYKPNLKADECHGVPEMEWQLWFGKSPEPLVMHLPPASDEGDEEEVAGEEPVAVNEEAQTTTEAAASKDDKAQEPAAGSEAKSKLSEKDKQRRAEFLELHPRLKVINTDETGLSRRERETRPEEKQKIDVGISSGRIVETSDGLFGADEVDEEEEVALKSAGGAEGHARTWLTTDIGDLETVEPVWPEIHAAKGEAQDLFKAGKMTEARQLTTATINALKVLGRIVNDLPVDIRMQAAEIHEADSRAAMAEGRQLDPKDVSADYVPTNEELDRLGGILHSNRSLLVLQLIQAEDKDVLSYGVEAAWRMVVKDADEALLADALNFKASFRRAQALFELGELTEALSDATRVVDHYASNSSSPNPEAAALRERILEAVRRDARKWGDKKRPAWNRGTGDTLVTEVEGSTLELGSSISPAQTAWQPRALKATNGYMERNIAAAPTRALQAPKTAADVEKTLLVVAKNDAERRKAYVQEYLPAESIQKFYKRAPLGPDVLAVLIAALRDLSREDATGAGARLSALAACPSATTHAAMFDPTEKEALRELVAKLGPEVAKTWLPEPVEEEE